MKALAILVSNRDYGRFWLGQQISNVGDGVRFIGLSFYVYDVTGSTLATGGMFMAQILPALLFGTFAGVFVDRWSHRRTMVTVDVLRAFCLLPLIGLSAERIWILYPVAFALSTFSIFYGPASNALIPRLVGRGQVLAANSADTVGDSVARLCAPLLGGALLGFGGLPAIVAFDAASYLTAAVLIGLIREPAGHPPRESGDGPRGTAAVLGQIYEQWLEGLGFLLRHRTLVFLFLALSLAFLGDSMVNVLFYPFAKDQLGVEPLEFGWLAAVRGLGGLAGGLLVGQLSGLIAPRWLVPIGFLGTGLGTFLLFSSDSFRLALGLMVLVGLPLVAWSVGVMTLLQTWIPERYRGRVLGLYSTGISLMTLVGSGAAGWLGESVEVPTLAAAACGLFLLSGILCLVSLRDPEELAGEEGERAPATAEDPRAELARLET